MRNSLLVAVLIVAAFSMDGGQGFAQQQTPPDNNAQPAAPQPQKKPAKPDAAAKPSPPSSPSSGQSAKQPSPPPANSSSVAPHSAADANPFPEDVSRGAAQAAAKNSGSQSSSPSEPASKHSAADANPFPEDVSRKAAQAAGKSSAATEGNQPEAPLPPGESSSESSSLTSGLSGQSADSSGIANPIRAKKDIEVGNFYLDQGDYRGAYLRYQDAMKSDPANIDAIFGAAEAARRLGKLSEAARNYQMYLEIEPNGSKAKRALKALKAMPKN